MSSDVFRVDYWLTQAAISAPLLAMLTAGLVICCRQRLRRPGVSKLLRWAILAELIWLTVCTPLLTMLSVWIAPERVEITRDTDRTTWVLEVILWSLPGSTIHAAIWGTVLWAVLKVSDSQDTTSNH